MKSTGLVPSIRLSFFKAEAVKWGNGCPQQRMGDAYRLCPIGPRAVCVTESFDPQGAHPYVSVVFMKHAPLRP